MKALSTIIRVVKISIDSIQFPLSLDACLREAASAKAGERVGVRVHYHHFYPPPLNPLPPGEGSFLGFSFSVSIFRRIAPSFSEDRLRTISSTINVDATTFLFGH
jgi:hypothetical protein